MNYKTVSHITGASIHTVRNSQPAFIQCDTTYLIFIRRSDNGKTGYQTNKHNADAIMNSNNTTNLMVQTVQQISSLLSYVVASTRDPGFK